MPYQIVIKKKAMKVLQQIHEPYFSNIKKAIYALVDNPRPVGCLKLKNRDGYRIRVADYRIIYEIIDDLLVVDVVDIGHRKDIYE